MSLTKIVFEAKNLISRRKTQKHQSFFDLNHATKTLIVLHVMQKNEQTESLINRFISEISPSVAEYVIFSETPETSSDLNIISPSDFNFFGKANNPASFDFLQKEYDAVFFFNFAPYSPVCNFFLNKTRSDFYVLFGKETKGNFDLTFCSDDFGISELACFSKFLNDCCRFGQREATGKSKKLAHV